MGKHIRPYRNPIGTALTAAAKAEQRLELAATERELADIELGQMATEMELRLLEFAAAV